LEEVREITAEWLERYNEITRHDALRSLPPARYRERLLAAETPAWNCLLEGEAYGQFAKRRRGTTEQKLQIQPLRRNFYRANLVGAKRSEDR